MRFIPIAVWLLACVHGSAMELALPESEGGFNDEPSIVRASDGSLYVAWKKFRDGSRTSSSWIRRR
jgi:hypothetical protein